MNRFSILLAVLLTAFAPALFGAGKRPYTPDDVHLLKSVSSPRLSPNGRWVAYVVMTTDLEKNSKNSDIWLVPAAGGEPRRLTFYEGRDNNPCWSPDSRQLAFISSRHEKTPQVHLLSLSGGEARRVTGVHGGVGSVEWAPDGASLLFTARVYPDCPDLSRTEARDEEAKKNPVKAKVHESLLYRHWDAYEDGKADHLFLLTAEDGEPRDLTPGLRRDALTHWTASAGREVDFSPDGRYVYFSGNQDDDRALSYNFDVYRVPTADGEVERLTDNPAADSLPRVSPDGRRLAYRTTKRPGYESDQYDLAVMDLDSRQITILTDDFDYSVGRIFWDPRGMYLYFEAGCRGDVNLFGVPAAGGTVKPVLGGEDAAGRGYHFDVQLAPDRTFFIYRHRPMTHDYEIMRAGCRPPRSAEAPPVPLATDNAVRPLSSVNQDLYDRIHFPDAEDFFYPGAGGDPVHGFMIRPLDLDPDKTYPLVVRIHGGPQQMFGYAFRHEYALLSGAGFAVFFCNPRGSTGYGQAFTDQVRGDWDGRVIEDIRRGVGHVLDAYPFVDPERVGAWGGSFGGFVCNWLQGHNEDGMFATLVSHAGGADQWIAYGCTEELWFPEWEMYGPPWHNPALADRLSPIRYAEKFATPHLITHGDLDWRVHVTGGEAMFTALQRQGVPSKMIRFTDAGHWITRPQDRRFWYASILEWFDRWLKK